MISNLVSIYSGSPLLGDTIQTNCIKLQTYNSLGLVFPVGFVYDFPRKIFCLIAFTY